MDNFEIVAYEKKNGEVPVEEFINSTSPKMQLKIYSTLALLQEKGNMLREPYSKYLEDGIYELRCKFGSNISRVFYFFYYDRQIVITNGFIKKTQKTPRKQLQIAKARRKDFEERMQHEKI